LKYDQTKDFVVSLDDIWKWLDLVVKKTQNVDYQTILLPNDKCEKHNYNLFMKSTTVKTHMAPSSPSSLMTPAQIRFVDK